MLRSANPACQTCSHRKNPLMGRCALEELQLLTANKSTQRYQKGQAIYQEGSLALGFYCVYRGKIKLSKTIGGSKEQIVSLFRGGDLLGYRALLGNTRYTSSAVALEESIVCFVPRADFLQLVQTNSQFPMALVQLLAHSLSQAEESMLHLAYKPVRERLAGALLLLQQTFWQPGEELPFRMALGREDLAALVGTAKETVSRLLSEFKEADIIATRGSYITILKPARLLEIATMYD